MYFCMRLQLRAAAYSDASAPIRGDEVRCPERAERLHGHGRAAAAPARQRDLIQTLMAALRLTVRR